MRHFSAKKRPTPSLRYTPKQVRSTQTDPSLLQRFCGIRACHPDRLPKEGSGTAFYQRSYKGLPDESSEIKVKAFDDMRNSEDEPSERLGFREKGLTVVFQRPSGQPRLCLCFFVLGNAKERRPMARKAEA